MRYLLIILFSPLLFGENLVIPDFKIKCGQVFSDSSDKTKVLYEFTDNGQELRIYGSSLKKWADQCQSKLPPQDELVISFSAKKFEKNDLEERLSKLLKRKVTYVGEPIWSAYSLEDLHIVSSPVLELKTTIDSVKNVKISVAQDYYVATKDLKLGQVLEKTDVKKESLIDYKSYQAGRFIANPVGLILADNVSKDSVIDERVVSQLVVEAGKELRVMLEINNIEVETMGVLTTKSRIGDIVKVKTKNQKVIQGHLVSSDLVKVTRN